MRGARGLHEETCLLDGVRNFGTSECEILKGAGEAAIVGRVIKKIAVVDGKFGSRVSGSSGWVAVVHPGAPNYIKGPLSLGKVKTVGRMSG
jgi:hypothetical protein